MKIISAAKRAFPLTERFPLFLQLLGRSPSTIKAYSGAVVRYTQFAGFPEIRAEPLQRYLASRRRVASRATVNQELCALRSWQCWLKLAAPRLWRPVEVPKPRQPPPRLVRALTDVEVGMLLAAPDLTTFLGLRDHVMMATLYQCGLKSGELMRLEPSSIRADGFLDIQGSAGQERLVPFGAAWRGLMETYLRQRARTRPGRYARLFVTRGGRSLRDPHAIWKIVNRHARRALGVSCGCTRLQDAARGRPWQGHYPHLLRASFATELHRRGCNLMAIAEMLGHASAETTTYCLGADLSQLRDAAACHPRALRVTECASR